MCRKGNISKADIGVIRVYDNETQFEISESVAADFTVNMRRPGGENIRVERMGANPGRSRDDKPSNSTKPKYVSKADRKRKSGPKD